MSLVAAIAVLVAVGLSAAAIVKTYQAFRRPQDRGHRLLILFFAPFALGHILTALGLTAWGASLAGFFDAFLGPNSEVLARNIVIIPALYAGPVFLLYASGRETRRLRNLLVALPLALWVVITVASWYAIPASLRDASFSQATEPARVVYFAVGIAGITYTTTFLSAPLTAVIARGSTDRRVSAGLWVAVVGFLLVLPLFTLPRVAAIVIALAGGTPPGWLGGTALVTQSIVIGMFVLGFFWPAAVARFVALKQWSLHRRLIAQMLPLVTALQPLSPSVRGSGFAQARLGSSLRGVHARFYQTVVECRDGLVLAGRLVEHDPDSERSPEQEAQILREALGKVSEGHRPPAGTPGPHFARPRHGETVEDDALALAALATAYRDASHEPVPPTTVTPPHDTPDSLDRNTSN